MINDLSWRKFPRDLTTSPKLRYVEKTLPQHLRHCGFLFMMHAYCAADDNGAIDIEDGFILADVLGIDSPDDVKLIADQLAYRGLLLSVTGTTAYLITDWDCGDRTNKATPLTADQRRAVTQRKIMEEKKLRGEQKPEVFYVPDSEPRTTPVTTPSQEQNFQIIEKPVQVVFPNPENSEKKTELLKENISEIEENSNFQKFEFSEKKLEAPEGVQNSSQNIAFLCPDSDKKTKNVANTERRERKETDYTEKRDKKDTHTETRAQNLAATALGLQSNPCGGLAAATETQYQTATNENQEKEKPERNTEHYKTQPQEQREQTDIQEQITRPYNNNQKDYEQQEEHLLEERNPATTETLAMKQGNITNTDKEDGTNGETCTLVKTALAKFFKKHNPKGFANVIQEEKALIELEKRIYPLGDDKNPAELCASVLTSQFKTLLNSSDYWKTMAVLPSNMLKPKVWETIYSKAQKIIAPQGSSASLWIQNLKEYQAQVEQEELEAGKPAIDSMYEQYGIDPNDEDRARKLCIAQKKASSEVA